MRASGLARRQAGDAGRRESAALVNVWSGQANEENTLCHSRLSRLRLTASNVRWAIRSKPGWLLAGMAAA